MSLRRKILVSLVLMMLVNGILTLFVLETGHLTGRSFEPEKDGFAAPGLVPVGVTLLVGIVCVSYLLFWTIRRQVLDPLDEIVAAAGRLAAGEPTLIRSINRHDEVGQLVVAFNYMAENILESRMYLEEKVKAATEKVERTQKELAFAERLAATGRLAAGVAHEINNPLGGIMNAIARLRKGDLPPDRAAEYLDLCDEGLKRIQGTVRRILDFSRKRPEVGPISVVVPLRQSVDLIRHLLKPNNITLVLNIEEATGDPDHLKVMADSGDLQHVFLNLLVNAVDAMPKGGTLTVTATQSLKWVLVEILDTGIGLTVEELSASFDYFHTTKPVGKGTGLGLSIAHHIVVGYHGALTLNSRKGEWTRATVELPAISAPRHAPPSARRITTRVTHPSEGGAR